MRGSRPYKIINPEPHLGDVIGDYTLARVRPLYRQHKPAPRRVERGTSIIITWVGMAVFLALIVLGVWLSFLFAAQPSLGRQYEGSSKPVLPWTCEQVRRYVAFASRDDLVAVARRMSKAQRDAVLACLAERT